MFKSYALCAVLSLVIALSRGNDQFRLLDPLVNERAPKTPPPPLAEHDEDGGGPAVGNRPKRAVSCGIPSRLTGIQATEALAKHNAARAAYGADMLALKWDDNLAARAQEWANKCDFSHDYLSDCQGELVGQNAFMATSGRDTVFPNLNMSAVTAAWVGEKANWNFGSNSCPKGKVCGHWTQVVWAATTLVGCGYANCPILKSTGSTMSVKSALVVYCDYSIAGNMAGELPFTPGASCSQCAKFTRSMATTPGYSCISNLCVPCSPGRDRSCSCGQPVNCLNGGSWDSKKCRCVCKEHYYGDACDKQCVDTLDYWDCEFYAGMGFCDDYEYMDYVEDVCASTCGVCT